MTSGVPKDPITAERCIKIRSETMKKLWGDPEFRKTRIKSLEKRWSNPEEIEKQKEIVNKRWKNPKERKKQSATANKRWKNLEERIKQTGVANKRWESSTNRKNQSKVISVRWNKPKERENQVELLIGGFWYGNIRYYQGPQYCEKFNEDFKERVRAFFGCVCPECGTPQPQNGKKLSVHHINFNKTSCCNPDAPRLFIPLCSNGGCHTKTNNNRKYWENYFTKMIMGYYEGKCYFTKEEMKAWMQ